MAEKSVNTKLKEALKRIEELEKELKNCKDTRDSYYNENNNLRREIDNVHAALDVLPGVVSKKVKVDDYREINLLINARLFAWVSSIAFGENIKIKKPEDL